MSFNREDFDAFIGRLELENFQPGEFLVGLDRGNAPPPSWIWGNIAIPAVLAQRTRSHFGRPVRITSSYRDRDYNRRVKGSPRSQHLAFGALDFKVKGIDPVTVAAYLRSLRGELLRLSAASTRRPVAISGSEIPFSKLDVWDLRTGDASLVEYHGGIGLYKTFVHVDARGYDVNWEK